MSPASQGSLEVERYIGSCLISSNLRVNNNNCGGVKVGGGGGGSVVSNVNHHNKGKKVADGGGGGGGLPRPGKLVNTRAGSCQEHHYHHQQHHHHGGYNGGGGGVVPLCECGGLKYSGSGGAAAAGGGVGGGGGGGSTRYGSAGRSWAGMPLISMASTGARRSRKPSTSSTGSAGKGGKGNEGDPSGQQTRTPLSRLAIHTQGAPLILAGRYNNGGNRKNNTPGGGNNKGPQARQFRSGEYPMRKYNNSNTVNNVKDARDSVTVATRDARGTGGVVASGGAGVGNNGNTPSSDSLSVASDESSGHSENSLPRIIKPRKRRKKDRKPPPPAVNPPVADSSKPTSSSETKIQESSNIVTLKPYVPLCYELYEGGYRKDGSGGGRRKAWEAPKACIPCIVDDERASQTSEEDAHDPKLHHEFDDVEEEEDADAISLEANNALFTYLCPSTSLCQCRYCDPAGLIWDVDQHCYSPFLTPPSPGNESSSSSSFANSPFANIPLFLNPPSSAAESRSFSLFNNNNNKDSSSSVFMPENESSSGLRRSWSDPSASRSASSSYGHPFAGFGLSSGSTSSEVSTSATSSLSSSSQSLEVSTEIVTSPNGHRDIEIKFYSSSPPTIPARELDLGAGGCIENMSSASLPEASRPHHEDSTTTMGGGGVWANSRHKCDNSVKVFHEVQFGVSNTSTWGCTQQQHSEQRGLWGAAEPQVSDHEGGVMSGLWDHEQSAKRLGEEVKQLRLQAEE